MHMEKRTILAFVLMALVLVVSQYFLMPPKPPPGAAGERVGAARPPADGGKASAGGDLRAPTAEAGAGDSGPGGWGDTGSGRPGLAAGSAGGAFAAPAGPSIQIETPLYAMTLSRHGGVVSRIFLRKHASYVDSLSVQLVPPGQGYFQRALRVGGREVDLTSVLFEGGPDTLRVAGGGDTLVLAATVAGAGALRQIFRFDDASYVVAYRLEGGPEIRDAELDTRIGPRLRSTEKNLEEDMGSFAAVARVEQEVHTLKPGDVASAPASLAGPASWAGIKSKYFLGAMVSDEQPFAGVTISDVPGDTTAGLALSARMPLSAGRASYRMYLGPQEFRRLTAVGSGLEDVNQYGWSWVRWMIQPFAHGIIRVLLWMHRYVPNYGVVLIIFGILVRLLMWPLSQKSFESMLKMQAVQPDVQRLRDRYKTDPAKMQSEMMRLYKERGVNPLGGCLPNLLPLPILFALFFVFQNTIEFRGAPFALWINDLSRPDPLYVLPILMGATMFIQQKLTATGTADNPQMKMMMYVMPAVLTFVFLNLASGLVLYYTVSNVLTFLQQLLLKRQSSGAAAPVPATK
ncbi:MAG: membrane protein insertase YidC [Gemmatimonadetes bacterium]|nr:membrane protein insertase YidC [Gemmatimonadota bacterium]